MSSSDDEKFQRKLNNAVFPGTCSSYHLHHVAGKVIALAEFIEYGEDLSKNTVANAQALASALAAEGFDVLAESRGYTASHQVLTRHGDLDSGAGAKAADLLEQAGIITNMNMLPGDTKAMTPSGLRLGVQELTRVGMGTDEMIDVARFYSRVLIDNEDPKDVKRDVHDFKSQYQVIRYCLILKMLVDIQCDSMPLIDEPDTLLDRELMANSQSLHYRDGMIIDGDGNCWYNWRSDGLDSWWRFFEEIIDNPMGRRLANAACDEEECTNSQDLNLQVF